MKGPCLGKPVLVLKDGKERMECVESGTAILIGCDKEKIVYEAEKFLNNELYLGHRFPGTLKTT